MTTSNPLWRVWLIAENDAAEPLEAALEPMAISLTRFEEKESDEGEDAAHRRWRIQALMTDEPDLADLALTLAAAAGRARVDLPDFHVEPVVDQDWLALNRRQFPPITAGRFFVHGSYFEGTPPDGKTVIKLDAGPAFGSGTHETTRGCLMAIDTLLREGVQGPALDVGCGSGILALAMAAAGGIKVIATDIDGIAAETTLENARANSLDHLVAAYEGEGIAGSPVIAGAPYGLITANILAEPLIALAPGLAGLLAPGGRLILSGLLTRQEEAVLAAAEAAGLTRQNAIVLGEWSTLILVREDNRGF
jgi:ribosomal protein L11 methyltransferase